MIQYGRLSLLDELYISDSKGYKLGIFECTCGNVIIHSISRVKSGHKSSCGCLQKETRRSLGEKRRLESGTAAKNELYSSYKRAALRRKYIFELTIDEFIDIIVKACIYCGDSCSSTSGRLERGVNGTFSYTGIDRYDNSLGYTLNNSVPCCKICNRIKTNMDVEYMKRHLTKMLKNSNTWLRTA